MNMTKSEFAKITLSLVALDEHKDILKKLDKILGDLYMTKKEKTPEYTKKAEIRYKILKKMYRLEKDIVETALHYENPDEHERLLLNVFNNDHTKRSYFIEDLQKLHEKYAKKMFERNLKSFEEEKNTWLRKTTVKRRAKQ